MGNTVRKLRHCCSCSFNGCPSHELMMTSHVMPHPSKDFVGHSFCYVRPDPTRSFSPPPKTTPRSTLPLLLLPPPPHRRRLAPSPTLPLAPT
ncbi:hypothetical protein GQ457_01G027110 [Hibiscus cannabinus]